ncbi:uncharacterized protein LOC129046756 [Molothrus ater]|uniref:uncharacterized protein LOC129046756 n=1 Tax=Molothrus ater TaxID=84834 RepID=UPI0023E8E8C0|nr:uncharacterized protein LOC129046756 [Molothrus ater]
MRTDSGSEGRPSVAHIPVQPHVSETGFLPLIQGLRPKWKGQQLPCILVLNKPCPLKQQRSMLGRMLECFAATEATSKRGLMLLYMHNDTESLEDSFTMQLTDGKRTVQGTLYIYIMPVNDEIPHLSRHKYKMPPGARNQAHLQVYRGSSSHKIPEHSSGELNTVENTCPALLPRPPLWEQRVPRCALFWSLNFKKMSQHEYCIYLISLGLTVDFCNP